MARRGEPRIPLLPVRCDRIPEQEIDLSTIMDVAFGSTVGYVLQRSALGWIASASSATLSLTVNGTSGPATYIGGTLNIPQYTGGASLTSTNTNLVLSPSTITTTGTFTVPTTGLEFDQYWGAINPVTQSSGTLTFNLATANYQASTLTQNATIALSNPTVGQKFILQLTQTASGGPYTVTWFSGITWMGTASTPTMPTTASAIFCVGFECIATNTYLGFNLGVSGTGSGALTSFTGDGVMLSTTPSTSGTATTATANANTFPAGPTTGSPAAMTQRGIVLADLPTIPTLNILANTTGGTAAPAGNTLSGIFASALSATQGTIPYMGASSTLGALAVGGTAGQILQTGGSAANPSWATSNFIIDQTNACPKWTAISDPSTPVAGDDWFSSSALNRIICRHVSATPSYFTVAQDGTFFRCGPCTAVTSAVALTSMFLGQSAVWGSRVIPGGTLQIGQWIEIYIKGTYSQTASSPTISMSILIGGTTVASNTLQTVLATTALTGLPWDTVYPIPFHFVVTGTSTPTGAIGGGDGGVWTSSNVVHGMGILTPSTGTATPVAITWANDQTIDVQFEWSTANASNTIAITAAQMRIRG